MRLKITKSEKDKFFFPSGHVSYQIYPLMCLNAINSSYFVKKKNNTLSPNTENAYLLQGCVFATNTFS